MLKSGLILALVMAAPFVLAEGGDTPPCSDAASHAAQRACLASLYAQTDARLKAAEDDMLAKIAAWDEDARYRSKARQHFLASIPAFQDYRKKACSFSHSLAGGGNGATDMRLACSIELSNQRIGQLAQYLRGLPLR